MSFQIGEKTFKITRKGFFGPKYHLWLGEGLVVSVAQTPGFNRYSVAYAQQVWTLKAIGLMARKFGLYQGDKQVGSILPTHLNPISRGSNYHWKYRHFSCGWFCGTGAQIPVADPRGSLASHATSPQ